MGMNIRKLLGFFPKDYTLTRFNGVWWLHYKGYNTQHASKNKKHLRGKAWEHNKLK